MKKDIGKRILAVVLCVCMVVGMVQVSGLKAKAMADITGATVELDPAWGFTYNGEEQKPAIKVKDAGGTVLSLGTDYTVDATISADYKSAGEKEIHINGDNSSVKVVRYHIFARDLYTAIEAGEIELQIGSLEVNSTPADVLNILTMHDPVVDAGSGGRNLSGIEFSQYNGNESTHTDKDFYYSVQGDLTKTGQVTVQIVGINNYENAGRTISRQINVTGKQFTNVSLNNSSLTYTGAVQVPAVTVEDVDGTVNASDYELTYYKVKGTTETQIAADQIKHAGKYVVKVTGKTGTSYEGSVYGPVEFGIYKDFKTWSDRGNITISYQQEYKYTGERITPDVVVKDIDSDETLEAGVDYRLEHGPNKDRGTGQILITGMGYYGSSNTIRKNFTILPLALTDEQVTLEIPADECIYTGATLNPTVKIMYNGSDIAADCTITFSADMKKAGTKQITVTGNTNNYTGTRVQEFVVTRRNINEVSATLSQTNFTYDGAEKKPAPDLSYRGTTLVSPGDYTFRYERNTAADTDTTPQVVINGTGNFVGEMTIPYNIEAAPLLADDIEITIVGADTGLVYTGAEIRPIVNVVKKDGTPDGIKLVNERDYELDYSNNEVAGNTASVIIVGKGNYQGRVTKYFEIKPKSIDAGEPGIASLLSNYSKEYTGAEIVPDVTVTYKPNTTAKVLVYDPADVAGSDYRLRIENNKDAGTAKVTITGQGNYCGFREVTFAIDPCTLKQENLVRVEGMQSYYDYKGENFFETPADKSGFKVYYKPDGVNEVLLNQGNANDYMVRYENNNKIGMATIYIDGNNINYKGTIKQQFEIRGSIANDPASNYLVIDPIAPKTYTGDPIVLTKEDLNVSFKYESDPAIDLVLDEDFVIEYGSADHTNAGTVTATIKGKDGSGYYGQQTFDFEISQKDLGDPAGLDINIPNHTYNSQAVQIAALGAGTTASYNSHGLVYDTDYELAFKDVDGDQTNRGTVTLVMSAKTGSQNYTGSLEKTFEILPFELTQDMVGSKLTADIDAADGGMIILLNKNITYADIQISNVKCEDNGITMPLVLDQDYKFSIPPDGISQVGTANLTLTANGQTDNTANFTGVVDIPFQVYGDLQKGLSVTDAEDKPITEVIYEETHFYQVDDVEPPVTVMYRGVEVASEDYTVAYSGDKANVTVEGAEPAIKITGQRNFINTEVDKTYTIIPFDFSQDNPLLEVKWVGDESPYYYTGSPITPDIKLFNNGHEISPTTEYTVGTPRNNINGASADLEDVTKRPTIPVTAADGNANYTGSRDLYFTITGIPLTGSPAGETEITWTNGDSFTYTGAEIKPEVSVVFKYTNGDVKTLTPKQEDGSGDYEIEYEHNTDIGNAADADAPKIIVKGINNFSGPVSKSFNITAKDLEAMYQNGQLVIKVVDVYYTGSQITPVVNIWDKTIQEGEVRTLSDVKPGKELTPGTDFTVTPAGDNLNAGTPGSVSIKGMNNYAVGNSFNLSFNILPVPLDTDASITVSEILPQTYQARPIEPKPEVKMGDTVLTLSPDGVTGDYILVYDKNQDVGNDAKVTIKGIGSNYNGEKPVNFKIEQKSLADTFDIKVADILAQPLVEGGAKPIPKVTFSNPDEGIEYELTSDDFTLSYSGNDTVGGNAVVTINGKGNFRDFTTKPFAIVANINQVTIGKIDVQNYTGQEIKPEPKIMLGQQELEKDTHFKYEYTSNINAGTATLTVVGLETGGFAGTKSVDFTISRDFSEAVEATGFAASYPYTGQEIKAVPGKVTAFGATLKPDKDYFLTYTQNTNVGTATVTVNGKGSYSGQKSYNFEISRRSIAQATVGAIGAQVYNGKNLTPEVTVTYQGKALTKGTDYTVVYLNNEKPGKGKVIISGKNNYSGSKISSFDINLDKVTGASGKGISGSKITFSWSKSGSVTGYEIYSTDNRRIARTSDTSYTVAGLKASTGYTYKIRSYVIKGGQTFYSSFVNMSGKTN